jgi:SAM-dependent methyltransferase
VLAAGRAASVSGIDRSPAAVEVARRRLPGADLRIGLIDALPWDDGAFDVVTAFNALQYARDPPLALAEARRVVRPGGLVAVCKWAAPAANELFVLLSAVRSGTVAPAAAPDHAGPAAIAATLRDAGLEPVGEGAVGTRLAFADLTALTAGLASSGGFPHGVAPSRVAASARAFCDGEDGSYRLKGELVYALGRVDVAAGFEHATSRV